MAIPDLCQRHTLDGWRERALRLEADVNAVVIGQESSVRQLIICTFARGHALLEGDVGVGKTTLLRALARGIGGAFERVEGTIDLMPAELVYYTYLTTDGQPRVDAGPLLRHGADLSVFFFNEINRARPQVHSLLLRAMAERSVSAFNQEHRFPHLQVFADRNRVERDETFEIPAAARDRFLMEINVEVPTDLTLQRALMTDTRYHDVDALIEHVQPSTLPYRELNDVARLIQSRVGETDALTRYALDLCYATRDPQRYGIEIDDADVTQLVQSGISPRGMSMLLRAARVAAWLEGRDHVTPADLHAVFPAVATHRIFFTPVYEMRRTELAAAFVRSIMQRVEAP